MSAPRADQNKGESGGSGEERLQKILAHAGVGSRRACEEVILQGRVTVNGQVVRELGTKVDSQHAKIAVDGQAIHQERMVYYAVSKPKGYVSTNNDPSGRPRVVDLLPEIPQRVYTVGRLDEMSTGLILLTNDGELANRLAHPRFGVEKLYRVVVAGNPEREVLDKLVEGVWLAEGKVRARRVRVVGKKGLATVLEMVLAEGKNREVRRMLAKLGHKVMSLTRVAVGPVTLKGLAPGEYRPLSAGEIDLLRKVAAGIAVPSRFSERKPARNSGRPRPAGSGSGSGTGESTRQSSGPARRPGGTGRPASGGPRRSGAPSAAPRGKAGGSRRPATGGPVAGPSGARPPRPEGLPPSQRKSAAEAGRGRPPRPEGASGGRPPRPEGLPPSQRRASGGEGAGRPPRPERPTGSRPPRPEGLPPSQRRASGGGTSGRPPRPEAESEGPPTRRIIGLDTGPARKGPPPRRGRPGAAKRPHPRSSLGPRRPRGEAPGDGGAEE